MAELSEERLGELIALLPPPPPAWTQAASELPRARLAIDELIVLANRDDQMRARILADLEQALRNVGVEPGPRLMKSLRSRLSEPD